jgi:hypothetical protein
MSNTTHAAHAVAAKEVQRWIAWLGIPMLVACICFGAALAGLSAWFVLAAIVVGPLVGGGALIYLALSTDTNGVSSPGEGHLAAQLAVAEPE